MSQTPILAVLAIFFSCVGLNACSQYEYASPQPGILEVRLGVRNTRTDLLPFSSLNSFFISLRKVVAKKSGNIQLEVFADLNAIRRNRDGDLYNSLDTLARDSALVLGKVYAPPGTFDELDIEVTPSPAIVVTSGFFPSVIEVTQPIPVPPALQQLPGPGQRLNIEVRESRLTRVTVTFDLDSSLVRRTEMFEYRPFFYVSSVQNF